MNSLGSTWLEILIAYACSGGTLGCADTELKMPTYSQAIKELRQRVRRIAALAFPAAYQGCFTPYGISFVRLHGLGVCTLLSGVQGKLCMSTELRDCINQIIVQVAHNLKHRKAEAVMRGEVRVFPSRFPLRRRTELFHSPPQSISGLGSATIDSNHNSSAPPLPRPSHFLINCPHCATSHDVAHRKLYGSSGWASLLCRCCGRATSARRWKCSCGKTWTACPDHQPQGYACVGALTRYAPRPTTFRKKRHLHQSLRRAHKQCRCALASQQRDNETRSQLQQMCGGVYPPDAVRECKRARVDQAEAASLLTTSALAETADLGQPCSRAVAPRKRRAEHLDSLDSSIESHAASSKRLQVDSIVARARMAAVRRPPSLAPPRQSASIDACISRLLM